MKYPKILSDPFTRGKGWSILLIGLSFQPFGYFFGWGLATLTRCSLREKLTIAFETGVQSFVLGLVLAEFGFNKEKEVCQFHPKCLELLGRGVATYEEVV